MNTRQRIVALAKVSKKFPSLGARSAADLEQWLKLEFGSVDALDEWRPYGTHTTRAITPHTIYHVLAGNLAVSGQHSLLCGLLLGAHNIVKLPSSGGEDIALFVESLPVALKRMVTCTVKFDLHQLGQADAVVAYGSDETVSKIRGQTRDDQIFLGYGLQVSLIWLGKVMRATPRLLAAVAHDVCIYDQMGCLSPQAIYLEPGSGTEAFCSALAHAMQTEIERLPEPPRILSDLGPIHETIDTAQGLGHRVWIVGAAHSGDTLAGAVIADPQPQFEFSCLHRVIFVREAKLSQLPQALGALRGKISTVGLAEKLTPKVESAFLPLGVKRFCPVGEMQHPPVWWHHDGRPSLADLVRWVDQG